VTSAEGLEVQRKLWSEMSEVLEKVKPGIMGNI
jgi:hypothetical protein